MEVIADLTFFAIFFLIGAFLLELYNLLKSCKLYEIQESIIVLAVGTVAYLFIQFGLYMNLTLEYNIYMWFSRGLLLLLWVFWIASLFIYAGYAATEPFTRMQKRRNNRINR